MAEENSNDSNYGGKRPLWQWVSIYAIIGLIIYGLIYYFVLAKKGGNSYNPVPTTPPIVTTESSPSSTAETTKDEIILTMADGFSPASLTIKVGDRVTWVNESGTDATVNSAPHPAHTNYPPLNLGSFSDGATLSLVFDKPGTYKYHNHLNPSQFGAIVVQ